MTRFLQPLWLLLAAGRDSELRQMVEYLREENRILRSKLPKQVKVTARERARLLKLAPRWAARSASSSPSSPTAHSAAGGPSR
jgi:hypothetical protein